MKTISLLLLSPSLLIISCKQVTIKINQLPSLPNSDSAVVMYYHTAGDPRFFNMIKVKGVNPLHKLIKDVNGKVITIKDSCTTQGKIYFYGKSGAVETVYFSRSKDCMTLSFIKTGEKYYTRMSAASMELLDSLEKKVTVLPGRQE